MLIHAGSHRQDDGRIGMIGTCAGRVKDRRSQCHYEARNFVPGQRAKIDWHYLIFRISVKSPHHPLQS
jgi:hypothetical protein